MNITSTRIFPCAILVASLFLHHPAQAQNFGGGPPVQQTDNCIPDDERKMIEANIKIALERMGGPTPKGLGIPIVYPFVPIAGTVWDDRFINNYVDLDSSGGILDWDCTDWTYNGHAGHDIDLRTFGEMDAGVPVYAALDGTVVDAHDFEFDRYSSSGSRAANYVVIYHGGTQYTWYYHLRRGSVAVAINQVVKAGQQIGLAGSSGNSTGPHLHFESRLDGTYYEPSAGSCRPGPSDWTSQIPIRRDMWIEDFGIQNAAGIPAGSFFPYDPPRTGTFVRSDISSPMGAWYVIHNEPAFTTWRARYLRPDNSQFYDSGLQSHNNSVAYRYATWWIYYNLKPDVSGAWTFELSINNQVMVLAPFLVLNPGSVPTNRPPKAVTAAFDPPSPGTNDVVFCRLTVPLLEDPDYDLMRYRFQWATNGVTFRDITNAAHADAIPHGAARAGDLLKCNVTPFDGTAFGPPVAVQINVGGSVPSPALNIQPIAGSKMIISWPTSIVNYALFSKTNLSGGNWQTTPETPVVLNGQNRITNNSFGTKFYRLQSQ